MAFVSISRQISTKGYTDCHNITKEVQEAVSASGVKSGIVTVFIPGSTAGLTTIEYEEGAVSDLVEAIERLIPQGIQYKHDKKWGDGNGFSHVRASFLGPSITVPLVNGELQLGTWQQIMLIDFDNRSRNRKYLISILGE